MSRPASRVRWGTGERMHFTNGDVARDFPRAYRVRLAKQGP